MTYELQDERTMKCIPDEYKKCFICETKNIHSLKRSLKCCHVICRACLLAQKEIVCRHCKTEHKQADFVSYTKDDSLDREKVIRDKLQKKIPKVERMDFTGTPKYYDFLEEVEELVELSLKDPDSDKCKQLLDKLSKTEIKRREVSPRKRDKQLDNNPNELKSITSNIEFDNIGDTTSNRTFNPLDVNPRGNVENIGEVEKPIVIVRENTNEDVQTKKMLGYSGDFVSLKQLHQALTWF
ncbi:RING-type domain-containing protein [Entamoeba marina]